VTSGVEKHLQDRLALLGVLEVVTVEVAGEGSLLEFVSHGSTLRKGAPGIKRTEVVRRVALKGR
jgi:hypothetical protein